MVSPGMSDGRCFTTYTANCLYNANIMNKLKLTDNNMYRKYLQENTSEILSAYEKVCTESCMDCIYQPLKQAPSSS
jgi:hypothetical protein